MAALITAPAAPDPDEHTCHAKACTTDVDPSNFMCLPHWRMLPAPMRDAIKALYRPGHEIDNEPSAEYLAIARAAVDAVAHKESRRPPAPSLAAPAADPVPAEAPAPGVRKPRQARKKASPGSKPVQLTLF